VSPRGHFLAPDEKAVDFSLRMETRSERPDSTKNGDARRPLKGSSFRGPFLRKRRRAWIAASATLLVASFLWFEHSFFKSSSIDGPTTLARPIRAAPSAAAPQFTRKEPSSTSGEVSAPLIPESNDYVQVDGIVRAGNIAVPDVFVTGRTPGGEMSGKTRSDGTFTLSLPKGAPLSFTVGGLKVISVSPAQLDGSAQNVVVRVTGSASVGGQVFYMGKAVAGAEVEFVPGGGRTATDENGKYFFHALPAGLVQLRAWHEGSEAESRSLGVPLLPGDSRTDVDIKLDCGASIAGLVLDQKGTPIPSVGVSWNCVTCTRYGQSLTDANGRFKISRLPPGDYAATVSSKGFEYESPTKTKFPLVSLREADSHAEVRLSVSTATGSIRGQVVDWAGHPVSGEPVLIPFPHRPAHASEGKVVAIRKTVTGEDGRFVFSDLPTGRYDIAVGASGDRASMLAVETGRGDVLFTLPGTADVRGTIEGFPAGPVSVRVVADPKNPLGFRRDVTVTGTEFLFPDVPSGAVWFLAVSGPYVAAELVETPVNERPLVLRAHPIVFVSGIVSGNGLGLVPRCSGELNIEGFGPLRVSGIPLGQLQLFLADPNGNFQAAVPMGFPLVIRCSDDYRTGALSLPVIGSEGLSGQRIDLDTPLE